MSAMRTKTLQYSDGGLLWCIKGEHNYLGFLQGRVTTDNEEVFIVGIIEKKCSALISPQYCRPAEYSEVQSGLLGVICTHPTCGAGTIIEEYFDGDLFVTVRCKDSLVRGFLLREVHLCCFS